MVERRTRVECLGGARERRLLERRTSLGDGRERAPRRVDRVERDRGKRRGSEPRATRASEPTSRREAREARGTNSRGGRQAERREKGKSRLLFSFLYGFCVNACGKAPVGINVQLYKCCRVSRSRGIFLLHCISFPCKYLHCGIDCKCFLIHV